MDNLISQFNLTVDLIKINTPYLLLLIGIIWFLHVVNWLCGYRLNLFGIYPRNLFGFFGIFFSPFLHGDFNHLFFNSLPLFVLASFVLLNGWPTFLCASFIIIFLGGFLVWLFGRRAIHIGASGLVMGYWSYLLINAYQQGGLLAIVLAGVCLYYFGGLVLNLFPKARTSWEAHVFGFIAGIVAAFATPALLPFFN